MRHRNLVIRRFGAMSFGIGHYENGVWVDHTVHDDVEPAEHVAVEGDRLADDIHAWYGCCESRAADAVDGRGNIAVLRRTASEPWRAESTPAGDAVIAN
jgi:hypothetical protein